MTENNKEELSVADFTKWLEGAEAFQEDDWCPNQSQWRTIRYKISQLTTTTTNPLPNYPIPRVPVQHQIQPITATNNDISLPPIPSQNSQSRLPRSLDATMVGPSISIGNAPVNPPPYKKIDKSGGQGE